MRSFKTVSFGLFLALVGACIPPRSDTRPERPDLPAFMRANSLATVQVKMLDGNQAIGIVVSHDGYIFTNQHVAAENPLCEARWTDVLTGKLETAPCVVLGDFPDADLSLVKVNHWFPFPVTWQNELEVGEKIYTVGFLEGYRNPRAVPQVVQGTIMSLESDVEVQSNYNKIKVSHGAHAQIPLMPGFSGGGIFSAKTGRCVGIISVMKTVITAHILPKPDGMPMIISLPAPLAPAFFARTTVAVEIMKKQKVSYHLARSVPVPGLPAPKTGPGLALPPLPPVR